MSLAFVRRSLLAAIITAAAPAAANASAELLPSAHGGVPTLPPVSTPLDPTPNYTPSRDYTMSREQFIATVKQHFGVDWSGVPFGSPGGSSPPLGGPSAAADAAQILKEAGTGSVTLNADLNPHAGSSVLGVPHMQTLYLAELTAQKRNPYTGNTDVASCYWEIDTSTPQATRNIHWGAAFMCNQPWIQGTMWAGAGWWQSPTSVQPIDIQADPVYDANWYQWKTYPTEDTYHTHYSRISETQLEDLYGYIDLTIDGGISGQDGFDNQPGGAGAYASYNCAGGALQLHVLCQVITDPFTFVATDDTQCATGDVCGPAGGAVGYASTIPGSAAGGAESPVDSPTDLAYPDPADPASNANSAVATASSFDTSNRYLRFCWGVLAKPHGHCAGPTQTWQYIKAQSANDATTVCARMYYPAAAKNVERLCGSSPVLVRWDMATDTARRLPPGCDDNPDLGYGGNNSYCAVHPFVGNAEGGQSAYIYGDGRY